MTAPCKECTERKLGCHTTCDKYQEFNKQRELIRQNRLKSFQKDEYFIGKRRHMK